MKKYLYGQPILVKDLIAKLQELPQNFPCYIRPKYHGKIEWWEDIPINANGICEMHPPKKRKNVTFLI